jgi:hypothetical protein
MPIIVSHDPLEWQSYDTSEYAQGVEIAQAWDAMARNAVSTWQREHVDTSTIEARYALGQAIRKIYESKGFVQGELPLLLRNFRLHLGQERKVRHGMNDYSLMYWFKLSAFPEQTICQLKVSQWVDCFDTNSMSEDVFLAWFVSFLNERPGSVSYETLRIFRTLLNANVSKMSLDHVPADEKRRIYAACMEAAIILTGDGNFREKEFTASIRGVVTVHRKLLDDVMSGDVSPLDYATQLVYNLSQFEASAVAKGIGTVS